MAETKIKTQALNLDKIQRVTVSSDITTTSTSYVDLTGATVTLTPSVASVFLIFFSAEYYNASASTAYYKIQYDAGDIAPPGSDYGMIQVAAGLRGTVAWTTLKTGVTVASHTVKITWKVSGGTGYTYGAELIVIPFAS